MFCIESTTLRPQFGSRKPNYITEILQNKVPDWFTFTALADTDSGSRVVQVEHIDFTPAHRHTELNHPEQKWKWVLCLRKKKKR